MRRYFAKITVDYKLSEYHWWYYNAIAFTLFEEGSLALVPTSTRSPLNLEGPGILLLT